MITIIGILLFVLCVSAHELGHAVQMRKYGIEMEEICLFGLGGPKIQFKTIFFGETPVTIRPLMPFGAFVRPKEDSIENLPKNAQVDINAGGVIVNIYAAFIMFILLTLFKGHFLNAAWVGLNLLVFYLGVRFFKAATIISIGVIFMVAIVYSLTKDMKSIGGIISIVKIISDQKSFVDLVVIAGSISLSLGLFNCVPLLGLDGQKILSLYLPEKVKYPFLFLAGAGILFVIVLALWNDFASL